MSHLYTIDHIILTLFHYLFFLNYWYDLPHDGRRTANSQAQLDLINLAASRGEIPTPTETTDQDDATRVALAQGIWTEEKVYAGWALIFGWLLKVSFHFPTFPHNRVALVVADSFCSSTSSSFSTRMPPTCDHQHTTLYPLPRVPKPRSLRIPRQKQIWKQNSRMTNMKLDTPTAKWRTGVVGVEQQRVELRMDKPARARVAEARARKRVQEMMMILIGTRV